ncbi:MAG: hypothetical protein M3Q87_04650 [Actinomycetota bacterium]|nr:hypothetical protein [Actinomycetota bacterium]
MVPDTVGDLPLHALAVHWAIVLVPLAAVLGLVFAVPQLRGWARVPLPLLSVAAAASTWVATQSGEALMRAGGLGAAGLGGRVAEIVERHEDLGKQLFLMTVAYAVVAVVAAAVAGRTGAGSRVLMNVVTVLLLIGAVAVGVQTYRVGDAGSEAVWNPTGNVEYSTD